MMNAEYYYYGTTYRHPDGRVIGVVKGLGEKWIAGTIGENSVKRFKSPNLPEDTDADVVQDNLTEYAGERGWEEESEEGSRGAAENAEKSEEGSRGAAESRREEEAENDTDGAAGETNAGGGETNADGDETVEAMSGTFMQVPVKLVRPSPFQPRSRIDETSEEFKDLVADIKARGVMVVPAARWFEGGICESDVWELLYGERRWRAAMAAGLDTIPMVVYEGMSDAEACERVTAENLQRCDLSPIEEGRAVANMMSSHGNDVRAVAARLGRTEKWVRLRAKLQDLSAKWQEEVAFPRSPWTVGHLELVSRFPEHVQDHALECLGCMRHMTVADFDRWFDREILHSLASAQWDLDATGLTKSAPACSTCRKRSSQCELLFVDGDGDEPNDRCLDLACWKAKQMAWLAHKAQELQAEHKTVLMVADGFVYGEEKKELEKHVGQFAMMWELTQAKKSDPGAKPCLIVTGPKAGTVRWMKATSSGPAQKKIPKTAEEIAAAAAEKLDGQCYAVVARELKPIVEAMEYKDVPAKDDEDRLRKLLLLAGCAGMEAYVGGELNNTAWLRAWAAYEAGSRLTYAEVLEKTWGHLRDYLVDDLDVEMEMVSVYGQADIRGVAGFVGFDLDAALVRAREAVAAKKEEEKTSRGAAEARRR